MNNVDNKDVQKLCDKLDEISRQIQTYNDYKIDEQYEGTVVFRYNTNNVYVPIISNIDRFIRVIKDINEYIRLLYKYGDNNAYLLDTQTGKFYTPEEVIKLEQDYTFINNTDEDRFIRVIGEQYVANKLQDMLDSVLYLISEL